jgi:hypothetical protein
MTRRIFAAPIAALTLIAAAPVPSAALASNSQSQSSESGKSDEARAAKGDRKICKTFHMSGSHARSERLCMTRAQWKEFDAAQEQN